MRYRRLLVMLAAVGGAFAAPCAASADPYPPAPPAVEVNHATVTAGQAVVFSGSGFASGESISIDVTYATSGAAFHVSDTGEAQIHVSTVVKTVNANEAGEFS